MTLLAVAVGGRGVVDPAEPVLRADDEALLRGRAAFETLRVYDGEPFRLEEHLARLAASAERLGLPAVNVLELEALAREALTAGGATDAVLRLYWTPAPLSLALVSALPDHHEDLRARGPRLLARRGPRAPARGVGAAVLSPWSAVNRAAAAAPRVRGADDAVFVDAQDVVLEGPTTNIWWRRGRTLLTPSLELGILAGVTRATVVELAAGLGYEVAEGAFPLADLAAADEAFTSSSVREVMPVVELDEASLGRGPAADELQAALRRAAMVRA